jgi:hypothetical protein
MDQSCSYCTWTCAFVAMMMMMSFDVAELTSVAGFE